MSNPSKDLGLSSEDLGLSLEDLQAIAQKMSYGVSFFH